MLKLGKENVCQINWLPRPAFYNQKTTSNKEMVKIGQVGGEDCLFFCYQNYCSHFSRNEQCLFCNLVSTSQTYDSVLKKKDTQDIGEVAKAAFSESNIKHVLITGGCFNHQKEINLVTDIVTSIKDHTSFDRVPGTILPSPAKNADELEKYYISGIKAIGFSMEIWDKMLYRAICPGKSQSFSHDNFVNSIQKAVEIFGEGNVYGVFVMGLETKDTFLDGVKTLTSFGANIVPFVWSPNPGSKFEGHRAPSSKWYLDTILEASQIVHDAHIPAGTENHCFKCDGNSLLHDALRLEGIE
jgi:biotin synthase-like enzyme